ncbi:MAG: hypothetical protein H7210_01460 [Pyrinomonadaceae bacterium]|nr:hypothetical protein [Phycisphaerales bacterium]
MRIRIVLACFASCLCSASALAQTDVFTFHNDSRTCAASFGGNGGGSAFDEPHNPYGEFQGGANLEVDNGMETWASHCDQLSSMSSTYMFMMSGASATLDTSVGSAISAQGRATFDIWFSSSIDASIQLSGAIGESGYATSLAHITLTTWAGGVVFTRSSPNEDSLTFSETFTLPAGNYRLVAESIARVRVPPGRTVDSSAMCSFLFEVAREKVCLSDLNFDGVADTIDFFMFITRFLDGNADFNQDGVTSSDDFFVYMRDYLSGC